MSAPLPLALWVRFQRYVEERLSGRASALRLKLSPATGARWARHIRETGRIALAPQGRSNGSGKLAPHVPFFEELITQDPDITLFELRDALTDTTGLRVQHSAIGHLLKRLGFTHKKVAGGHRAPPRQSETAARRLVQSPPSSLHAYA